MGYAAVEACEHGAFERALWLCGRARACTASCGWLLHAMRYGAAIYYSIMRAFIDENLYTLFPTISVCRSCYIHEVR